MRTVFIDNLTNYLFCLVSETDPLGAENLRQCVEIQFTLFHWLVLLIAVAATVLIVWPLALYWQKRRILSPRVRNAGPSLSELGEFGRLHLGEENMMLIDNLPIYVYAEDIDNDFRHVVINKKCEELWGRSRDEILGKSDYELFGVSSEIDEFRRTDIEAAKSNVIVETTLPVTGADGQTRICQFFRKRLDLPGNRHWLFGMAIDISPQKEFLDNQIVLNQCFENVLGRSFAEDCTAQILKALCLRMKASRCYLFQYDLENKLAIPICEYLADPSRPVLADIGIVNVDFDKEWYDYISSGDIFFAEDVNSPNIQKQLGSWNKQCRKFNVKSLYSGGVKVNGKPWGTFGITYETGCHSLTEVEKGFFQSATHLLGLILERKQEHLQLEKTKEENQIWELLSNAVSFFFFVKDMTEEGKHIVCNRAFAESLGLTPEQVIGKTDFDIFQPDEAKMLRQHDLEILNHPEGMEIEERLIEPRSGEHHYYFNSKRPYISASGHKLLLCCVSDTTELHNIARCEQMGNGALTETVNEPDFSKALGKIADTIMNNMNADRIFLVKKNEDGYMKLFEEWLSPGSPSCKPRIDVYESLWNKNAYLLENGRILMISNAMTAEGYESLRSENVNYKTKSWIAAAISVQDDYWGILIIIYDKKERKFSISDENIARLMTNIIAAAIVRYRITKKLHAVEYQNSMILDNIHFPLWLFDGQGNLIRTNNEAGKLIDMGSVSQESPLNKDNSDQNGDDPVVREALKTGKPVHSEFVWKDRNYTIDAEPMFDETGELACVVKSAVDVTEQNTMIKYQKIVNFCMEAFFKEEDSETAINRVLSAICRYMNASRAFIIRINTEQHLAMPFFEYDGDGFSKLFAVPLSFKEKEPWIQTLLRGEQVLMPDAASVESKCILGSWQPIFGDSDTRSLYFSELFLNNKLFGKFGVIYNGAAHEISDYEKRFLATASRLLELLFLRQRHRQTLIDALASVKRSSAEKNVLLENEHVLNQGMNAVLSTQQPMDALNEVMRLIGQKIQAARVFLLQFDLEKKTFQPVAEYYEEGRNKSFDFESFPLTDTFMKNAFSEKVVFIDNVWDKEAIQKYSLWEEKNRDLDIRSVAIGLLRIDGKVWGNIGLCYEGCSHVFSQNEKDLLMNSRHLIELIVQRTLFQERLVAAMEQAQTAARAKSMFLASMSHEIRTPLNAVIGFAELMKDGSIPKEIQQDYLDGISRAGNALLALINDVLDLSKLESGQIVLAKSEVDFADLLREMKSIFRQKCQECKLDFIISVPDDLPIFISDKLRMRQILFNLIGNAIKFTDSGSITVIARFTAKSKDSGNLAFSVIDTGIGIAPDEQKKLFQMFYQARIQRNRNAAHSGTGLGLALVRRLVDNMNGKVSLESEPGKGSAFTVEMFDIPFIERKYKRPDLEEKGHDGMAPNSVSVLLVDDIDMNLKVMGAMLKKLGFAPVTVNDSQKALHLLEQNKFEILFTDLWMPGMNGADLAKSIRQSGKYPDIKIVAITADIESESNFDMSVFDEVMSKPVSLDKFRKFLKNFVC